MAFLGACEEPTEQEAEQVETEDVVQAPAEEPEEQDRGPVVARVGDVNVYASELEAAAARRRSGEELSLEQRKELLEDLIADKALYLEARQRGLDEDPQVQKVMINTLLRQVVTPQVRASDFPEEELQAYFEENADDFVIPEKVQINRMFIRTGQRSEDEARAKAEDLRAQVQQNPERFASLAREYSEDPYRRRGGDLGFVTQEGKPGIDPTVVQKAFELEVGELSEVFEGGGGYNVVRVTNRRERVERSFDQMRGSVLRQLRNQRHQELHAAFVEDIRADVDVDIDEATLADVELSVPRRPGMRRGVQPRLEGGARPGRARGDAAAAPRD